MVECEVFILNLFFFEVSINFYFFVMNVELCSYEDWGVDELIVEDSWKRQVGGD